MCEEVQRVPDVQTAVTVRAFSGTLSLISGGVMVCSADPFTASTTAVEDILVTDRNEFAADILLVDTDEENPFTSLRRHTRIVANPEYLIMS